MSKKRKRPAVIPIHAAADGSDEARRMDDFILAVANAARSYGIGTYILAAALPGLAFNPGICGPWRTRWSGDLHLQQRLLIELEDSWRKTLRLARE